ncbi:hypothetical protein ACFQ4N_09850 [Oceanobacillus iheyensis]|uniref:Hypothetical conserved protein n=1 Tax=Oceanobacillus iheyensis (strain DSM 14371 / CIP 107618 / JCM 11309 / KCTC 3954 / HTE831) TaxID=221109 RepID=Q8ERK7_OCEIH|nr:hypothetical protein [Oceanobacillus iheyensis]BAC13251.1 hypothetical conserved protein [Oceanobacillus iheyensis HTE831]
MKKYMWLLLAVFVLIIIGGCGMNNEQEKNLSPSEMNAEDLPDVPALQDEFTREFIQSTEPVREGYYPFLSKSKSFTMDFPQDMIVNNESHIVGPDNRSETITWGPSDRNLEVYPNFILHYYRGEPDEENSKNTIKLSHDRDLNFEDIKTNNETYLSIADYKFNEKLYSIAALSWSKYGEIQIGVSLMCEDNLEENQCQGNVDKEKENIIEILKTIDVIDNERK